MHSERSEGRSRRAKEFSGANFLNKRILLNNMIDDFRKELAFFAMVGMLMYGAAAGIDVCAKYYRNRDPAVVAEGQREAAEKLHSGAKAYIAKYDLKGSIDNFVKYFKD